MVIVHTLQIQYSEIRFNSTHLIMSSLFHFYFVALMILSFFPVMTEPIRWIS